VGSRARWLTPTPPDGRNRALAEMFNSALRPDSLPVAVSAMATLGSRSPHRCPAGSQKTPRVAVARRIRQRRASKSRRHEDGEERSSPRPPRNAPNRERVNQVGVERAALRERLKKR
jgi:hypothetical protein